MKNFNLSRWALEHKSLVVYLMLVAALAGIMDYRNLGREEDPPFTIKTMVIKTLWPGATAGNRRAGHRPHREEARGAAEPRLPEELHQARRSPSSSSTCKDATPRSRRCRTSGIRCARRSATSSRRSARRSGPFFNDEFGDTYSAHLRFHLRRLLASRVARPCRACCARELLQRARRRQGRYHRRAGREDLPRILDPAARRPGARHFPS